MAARLLTPLDWRRYASRHPSLEEEPRISWTGSMIPGDPLNVALVGTEERIVRA